MDIQANEVSGQCIYDNESKRCEAAGLNSIAVKYKNQDNTQETKNDLSQ